MTRARDVANIDGLLTAKGDTYVATSAGTPNRLAVGADYSFMQALAAETTGTQWGFGLTGYTPTVTASSGSITSVTANGYWLRLGRLVFVSFNVKITNNGTGSGNLQMTLPFTETANVRHTGTIQETDIAGFNGTVYVVQSTAQAILTQAGGSYAGGTNYRLQGNVWYEVA
jgi:hypothetical protein